MLTEKASVKVLIISGTVKGAEYFTELLSEEKITSVITALNAGEAKRILVSTPVNIVIINTPLPDEFGIETALDIAKNESIGILLLVKSDLFEQVTYKVEDFGILTLQKPTPKQSIIQSLKLLLATRAKLEAMQEKTITLENKMQEIRIINRAKLLLIEQLKITEPQAHRYIEKQAMDACVKRIEIAENIIRTYEN